MTYNLLSYRSDSGPRGGILVNGRVHDVADVLGGMPGGAPGSILDLLADWGACCPRLEAAANASLAGGSPLGEVDLLPPILWPSALFCAGANYADHVAEMRVALNLPDDGGRNPGDLPWHYVGLPRHSMIGHGAEIKLPSWSERVDWEAEIGAVIGREARNVSVADALQYVAGLTIVNDLSARDWVKRTNTPAGSPFQWDWVSQKCFETAKPTGPWITPLSAIRDIDDIGIRLWVNDELMQDSSSNQLIFDIAEQVAHLSTRVTLRPGDVIATGTPAGVGAARGRFLQPGDKVRIRVEGVGELCNPVRADSATA